jgi:hypothetical protein
MTRRWLAVPAITLVLALAQASPALAEPRDFCANRPGLDAPACTLAPGDAMVEVGLLGWDHQADATGRDDTLTLGVTTLRYGLTPRSEIELSFTSYVHDRTRDSLGAISASSSVGDATIAYRRGLAGPNGPIAIQAFVSLPVGKSPGGAGDWGAGVLVPIGFNLGQGFQLELTPEADAAVNASGSRRHFAFGTAAGISHGLGKSLSLTVEASIVRDLDPTGHETQAVLAESIAWAAGKRFQLDVEADERLAGGVPDRSLMFGLARRFR